MNYNMESKSRKETTEQTKEPEHNPDSERLAERETNRETYDDCAKKETQESRPEASSENTSETAEDDFEDCESQPEESAEADAEEAESTDEFDDCAKDGGDDVEEKESETDESDEDTEEATEETDESDEATDEGTEKTTEEATEETAETDEATDEDTEEATEEINEIDEATDEATEKATEETHEIDEATGEDTEKLTEETDGTDEATDKTTGEATEETDETDEATDENAEDDGRSKRLRYVDDELAEGDPEKAEEENALAHNGLEEEIKENAEHTDGVNSFREQVEIALQKDGVTSAEVRNLAAEHQETLNRLKEEQRDASELASRKFEELMSGERNTEGYKNALSEYNALREQKEQLDERVDEAAAFQNRLEEKSRELQQAQIDRGEATAEALSEMLLQSETLNDRFENAYVVKPNREELGRLREDNTEVIGELLSEKDALKLAMDAKMEQISDYVTSNNMERFDTRMDPHYQQMTQEYLSLKAAYDRAGLAALKLDENNAQIADFFGEEYHHITETPRRSEVPEVCNGTDQPGETDYFADGQRAKEVLSRFGQERWEQLTPSERRHAMEELADYHASILGVREKPELVYYKTDDPGDYGKFSNALNVIYINENNLDNAAETADTISHEYRHKYQHERAELLENDRDLAYRTGFENYIRPENDYEGYQKQLVEADAIAYANAVREKLREVSGQTPAEIDESAERTKESDSDRTVPSDAAPHDIEQKEKLRETLEAKELEELRELAGRHYDNGRQVWSQFNCSQLESYKEHNDIEHGHIEKVRVKTLEASDVLNEHFRSNSYDGLFAPTIDPRTMEVIAVYHDTGMDGNIRAADYEKTRAAYLANNDVRRAYVEKALDTAKRNAAADGVAFDRAKEEAAANARFEESAFEEHIRRDHSLESAIHVLRDRERVENLQVNADEVALGCFVHSKSNSGLRHIGSEDDWATAVEKLESRVNEFNSTHPDEQIRFDRSFLLSEDGAFRQEKLAQMRSEAVAIRIGDANGHDSESRISQGGKEIAFTLEEKAVSELPLELKKKNGTDTCQPFFEEVQRADVRLDGTELDNNNDPEGFARMFAVGEGNFRSLHCTMDESGTIEQEFVPCDGNAFPLSTQHCIEERINEYRTASPMQYKITIHVGDCDPSAFRSYLAFAERMEDDEAVSETVRVEVIP